MRIIAVAGTLTQASSEESCTQDEKIHTQIDFKLNYQTVISTQSRFVTMGDMSIVKACLGVNDVLTLARSITNYQARSVKENTPLSAVTSEKTKRQKKTNALTWILRGSFSANSNKLRNASKDLPLGIQS